MLYFMVMCIILLGMPSCSTIKYGTPKGLTDKSRITTVSEAEESPRDIAKSNSSYFPLYMNTTSITKEREQQLSPF